VSRVAVRGIRKRFGDLLVLQDVSFCVEDGESVALLGPSGCGKSTLLRILLGHERCDAGTTEGALDGAGYLPQGGQLFPWKTTAENAELPLTIRRVSSGERRRRVQELLPAFGLAGFEAAYPSELSGGMAQRAALLRAVVSGAPLLILDEPFGALDTITRHRLQDWLAELRGNLGRSMLFVTHDLEEAIALADRVILLTERPATIRGELAVRLSACDRTSRLSRGFLVHKDALMDMVTERNSP